MQSTEIAEVLNRPISQELLAHDLTRLAYVAKDGTPRSIPIGFTWNGSEIVMCTAKNAPKFPALRHNPAVGSRGPLALRRDGPDRRDPHLGEADRLRDEPPERGRGAGPAAGRP